MKRLIMAVAFIFILVATVVACASPPQEIAPPPDSAPIPAPMSPGQDESFAPGAIPSNEERMIVRSGDISLVVEGVVGARDEIAHLAVSYGGYVVSSQISGEEQEMRGYISIRVPDEKFESALAELRDLAVRVISESTSSQDVTEEYVDLESRLKNAQATES